MRAYTRIWSDTGLRSPLLQLASRDDAFSTNIRRSRPTFVSTVEMHGKRTALVLDSEDASLKRRKYTHSRTSPKRIPPRLTKNNLIETAKRYSKIATLFDEDAKSRVRQDAGRQMGFHLRLECYEQAATNIIDWIESTDTLFKERPIFKDSGDISAMGKIAKSFEAAFAPTHKIQCQA
jgi:hypothetical protein